MKYFALAALVGLISARDTTKVWELRSVLSHRDEAVLQKNFGDVTTERANSRPPMRSHIMTAANQASSSSSSSSSDDEDLQLRDGDFPNLKPGDPYPLSHNGGKRLIPERFSADSDDLFMRSMLKTYAIEVTDKEGVPTGVFIMDKPAARAAAVEILGTHKGMDANAINAYLNTYFDKAWGHFDVNQTGSIAVYRSAELMRFLCSDQYMSLG
jgi:hypothetical protein